MASRTNNAKRNIIWGIINKVAHIFIPFIVRTILIKKLGTDYLGLSSLFTSILQVLNLSEMGFSSAVVFSMYKPIAESDYKTIGTILLFYKRIYRYIGIFIMIVGLFLTPFIPFIIKGGWPNDINIYILYIIYLSNTAAGYILFGYKSALLLAHQRNDVELKVTTVVFILQYIFQIGLLYIINNFYVYSVLFLVFTVLGNVLRCIVVNKIYPQYKNPQGELDPEIKKGINKRVAGAFLQRLCAATRNSFDNIFLSMYLGLTTITIYGNYFYILTSIHGFLFVLITSITAGVGDSIARESVEKNEYDLRKFSFIYAWISGWCCVCLLCLYQPFMKIWMGDSLMFPNLTVVFFCLYFYSLTIGDVKSAYTTGAGLWWEGRYRSVAETAMNIALNAILGYFFGVNGIIIATFFSLVLVNFLWGTRIVFKYYFKNISSKRFLIDEVIYAFVTLVVCLITYFSVELIPISESFIQIILRLVLVTLISNMVFLIAYCKLPYFKDTKKLMATLIKHQSIK